MKDQISRIAMAVEHFDSQGWHRTGTEEDAVSGAWLKGEIETIGLQADLEAFDLSRIVTEKASVETSGRTKRPNHRRAACFRWRLHTLGRC